eukprot:7182650-Lingulodinium_polyedra.AAC.1
MCIRDSQGAEPILRVRLGNGDCLRQLALQEEALQREVRVDDALCPSVCADAPLPRAEHRNVNPAPGCGKDAFA